MYIITCYTLIFDLLQVKTRLEICSYIFKTEGSKLYSIMTNLKINENYTNNAKQLSS